MKKVLGSLTVAIMLLFAISALAADKVIVPLGGKKATGDSVATDVLEGKTFSNPTGADTSKRYKFWGCRQAALDECSWSEQHCINDCKSQPSLDCTKLCSQIHAVLADSSAPIICMICDGNGDRR